MPKIKCPFTKAELQKVGDDGAAGWGARCEGWTIHDGYVEFKGNEYGEKFVFDMTFQEIQNELDGKEYTLEELKCKIENPKEAKRRGLM